MEKLVLSSIERQILVKLYIGCRRQTRHVQCWNRAKQRTI